MVIGYGFKDPHINASVRAAVERGLQIFVIAPDGADLAFKLSPTRERGQIPYATPEENMLKRALIGASHCLLAEIFGNGNAEFSKVMRFFSEQLTAMWDELLTWLDELEAGMTGEHRAALTAVQP